jgi:hypothetical protein
MSRIVAGRFDRSLDADAALLNLQREGFVPAEVSSFYVAPPGQHGIDSLGGDAPHSSEGSRHAGWGAALGAVLGAAIGLVIGSLASAAYGPVAALIAAGLGAYVGSFIGAMSKVRAGRRENASLEHPVESAGGRMIAICVDRAGMEERAVTVLRRYGARDIGRTQGEWRDGDWRDFDPRSPLAAV